MIPLEQPSSSSTMRCMARRTSAVLFVLGSLFTAWALGAPAQPDGAPPRQAGEQPVFHIYAGSTHAHTAFTWSHGEQWVAAAKGDAGEKKIDVDPDGAQRPSKAQALRPEWEKFQGPPAAHFALAKAAGYDFYVTTDHSQEAAFQPPNPANANWAATTRAAAETTDARFVALIGYEHSENNGPGGKGHINVINSAEYLNAMAPGITLPHFYKWLKTAKPNGEGPVVATFNHPSAQQYNDWGHRDDEITDIITMLEVINSNKKVHYEGFLAALDKGWKVSPVCGNDNHGLSGIRTHTSRTFVLATERTKPAILDAMKHRRTYAALDQNIQCTYTVNGSIMGSTLDRPDALDFDISISDPDVGNLANRVTKIEIIKDGGAVAEAHSPTPAHAVKWKTTIRDPKSKYFFVRIWNAGEGDAAKPAQAKPVAWLAPVWTGR
jgi:hypothetical protein